MDNVVGVLQSTLSALGDSKDPCKESLLVYAIKLEIRRVLVNLEFEEAQRFAVGALPPDNSDCKEGFGPC
jgi:hypothetical protein